MNREIKFRAWDKAYNVMVVREDNLECLPHWLAAPEIFEVMQFTGLHDKNGKEIYEGDVVRTWSPDYPNNKSLKVIEWKNSTKICGFNIGGVRQKTQLEVIGNVYEQPELVA